MTGLVEEDTPHLYLDTNIILDALDNRWAPSIELVEAIRTKGWLCSTSHYTVLELLDIRQEESFVQNRLNEGLTLSQAYRRLGSRRWGKLALKVGQLQTIYDELTERLQRYPFITYQRPLSQLWNDAEDYLAATNIGAVDSIHLATSIGVNCHVLVTRDQDFQKIAKEFIPTEAPEAVEMALREQCGLVL